MKNLKITFSLLIIFILVFSINSFATTNSEYFSLSKLDSSNLLAAEDSSTEEIDPYKVITFPASTLANEIKISVDDSEIGSYNFFYQIIELTDSQYTAIDNARTNYNNDIAAINEQIKNEEAELTAEQEKCKELQEAYQAAYEKDPTSEETAAAKKAFDDAYAIYSNHREQAVAYVEEQASLMKQKLADLYALYPKYDDSQWIASANNTASYTKTVTKKTYLAVWVKVEAANNTLYAVADYAVNPASSQNPSTPSDGTQDANTQKPSTPTPTPSDDNTKAPTSLPAAGSSIIIFSIIALISVAGGYCYIKYNTIDR